MKVLVLPSTVLRENENFELSCSYDANPIASLIQLIIDETILSTAPYHKVTNISRHNSGLYRCIVTNDVGSGMDEVTVTVMCKLNKLAKLFVKKKYLKYGRRINHSNYNKGISC